MIVSISYLPRLMLLATLLSCVLKSQILYACEKADLVIYNTKIYTANDQQWTAQAVAVLADKIIFVGTNQQAQAYLCGAAKTLDLAGMVLYPGLTDSHQHVEGVGERPKTLSLFGLPSLQTTVNAIKDFAQKVPDGQWIQGRGWIEREWTDEQRFLTKHDVDFFSQNKPLFIPRADGVSALVNSKALALAGINQDSADPVGGKFERDVNGEPTGYVLATAMQIFRDLIPAKSREYKKHSLEQGMLENAKMGWTSTHDAGMPFENVELIKELHAQGRMATRIYASANVKEAATMLKLGQQSTADKFFTLGGIKVYIDGTLGSRGAALIHNYSDANHNGFMNRTTQAELEPILRHALRQGIQIQTHAIGDRALRSVLDWYQQAFNDVPMAQRAIPEPRWRLEHAQVIPPADQQRMQKMGILASMQPSHAIGDLNFAPARLGSERLAYAYPWQQLVEQGVKVLGGSDAPVEAGDPRIEFYAAVTRQRLDGSSGKNWHPELAVSRQTALKMFTLWPAYGAFQEQVLGSIEVGKYADFSVFDTDWLTAAEDKILTSENIMTIVGGKITYQKGQE
ncbi:amidohydrolase [Paraglaciecola aestuariivivens]